MCKFKSAIVLKNGDVLQSAWTDSHEDLIDLYNLNDNGNDGFCRIEYVPTGEPHELDKYELTIDEQSEPDWFYDIREKVTHKMHNLIKGMLVNDNRKLLLGGQYIIYGNAIINKIKNANINYIGGNCKVNSIEDNCKVDSIGGNCKVNYIGGNCKVDSIGGNCKVNYIEGNCKVNYIEGNCKVDSIGGNCKVNYIEDNCKVDSIGDNCKVDSIGGKATIINDNRQK